MPTELVEQVASLLATNKHDLSALRLVSKWMLKNTQSAVLDGLFRKVRCTVTFNNLTRLIGIAEHPIFGPAVRVLELHPSYDRAQSQPFPRAKYGALLEQANSCASSCDADHTPTICEAGQPTSDEVGIEEGGVPLLALALKHLPNLRDVCLGFEKSFKLSSDPHVGHPFGPWADKRERATLSQPFQQIVEIFLQAIASSAVSLANFQAGYMPDHPYSDFEQSFLYAVFGTKEPMRQANVRQRFADLQTLSFVAMQIFDDEGDTFAEEFQNFLCCMPKLVTLELCFDQKPFASQLDDHAPVLLAKLELPLLRSLKLQNCRCASGDLNAAITRNPATLRSLELRECLMPRVEDWQNLLRYIGGHKHLELNIVVLEGMTTMAGTVKSLIGECHHCNTGHGQQLAFDGRRRMCPHCYWCADGDVHQAVNALLTTMVEVRGVWT